MDKSLRNLLINSTLAFIAAFFITTIVHESGHFIAYYIYGADPVLYHNHVSIPDQNLSIHVSAIAAMAGPIASLLQGIFFSIVVTNKGEDDKVFNLCFLWLSLLGFVNFFGYLMLTPLSTAGDTGKFAELLNLDYLYRILIAIMAIIVLILIILKLGKNFGNFIPVEKDMIIKKKYVYRVMFYPILIGSVVNSIFAFPIPVFLSIFYPATSSFVIMSSFGVILRSPGTQKSTVEATKKIDKSIILLTISLIIINRLLTMGLG